MKGIMPGLTARGHGRLRMTEGPQVRFLKEDENYVNGDHKQLQ